MRSRVVSAAVAVLAGVFGTSSAFAAAPVVMPPLKLAANPPVSLDRTSHFVNFNLGGLMSPGLLQDVASLRPTAIGVSRGVQLELSRGRNWDPYADLFPASASLTSAYLSGTNTSLTARFAITPELTFDATHVSLGLGALSDSQPSDFARDLAARSGADLRSIGTTTANLNWNLTDWAGLAITAAHANGNVTLMSNVPASLRGAGATDSSALGISARVGFGEGWVTTLTYAEGVTQLDLSRDKLMSAGDPLRSQSYGIGLAKKGVFGDDALGIALSRPLQIVPGGSALGALNTNFALANTQARESDVELGYVTTFLDGTLALQANAAYQLNAAGARGQNAVAGVARAKLNF